MLLTSERLKLSGLQLLSPLEEAMKAVLRGSCRGERTCGVRCMSLCRGGTPTLKPQLAVSQWRAADKYMRSINCPFGQRGWVCSGLGLGWVGGVGLWTVVHFIALNMIQHKMKQQKYLPLVISGCSGVGKGTLITNLLENFPELFELSVSYTTRGPRPGEVHGKHYFFVSRPEFEQLIKKGDFLQHNEVHGNYYGTSDSQVQSIIARGKICLLDIDIQGAVKAHEKHDNWNFLFIVPPSIEELEARLRGRGTESEPAIKKRVANAKQELTRLADLPFYKRLTNDSINECYSNFINLINQTYHLLIEVAK